MQTSENPQDMGPMETAVTSALSARAQRADPRDVAGEALALAYARLIDEPAPAAKYADALAWLRELADEEHLGDRIVQRHVKTIMTALAEHTVMSDLGPKLQSTLDAMKLTPKSRAQGKGETDAPATPARARLDELRARRDRKRYPSDLDSPAP